MGQKARFCFTEHFEARMAAQSLIKVFQRVLGRSEGGENRT
jgi:hypothetical protein